MLTIFIDKKNEDGSYNDIFIDDSTKENSKMIYAKNGILIVEFANQLRKEGKNLEVAVFERFRPLALQQQKNRSFFFN